MPAGAEWKLGVAPADATPPVQVSAQEQASQEEFVRDHDRDGARRDVGGPSMAVPPAEDVPEHAADGLAHEEVPLDRYDAGHALGADAAAIEAPQALAEPETPNAGRFAEPSERTQQEGQEIQKVAATASDPFQAMQASDLPAEPRAEDPLVPAAEVELEPQAETPQADVQQAAGQEPTLAEPRDPPYGRRATPDRNGSAPRTAARDLYGEPGPNAAPSVEHTPLNAGR